MYIQTFNSLCVYVCICVCVQPHVKHRTPINRMPLRLFNSSFIRSWLLFAQVYYTDYLNVIFKRYLE